MLKNFAALTACVCLAACTPAADTPPQTPGDTPPAAYMALGTEPGWTLEITPSRLNYDGDYGETKIMVPNPGAKPSANGRIYATDRLSVVVEHTPCSDGMSDRRYRDTVTVTADSKTVTGCGGGTLLPDKLAGTNWTFVVIGKGDVAKDRPTTLSFDGKRMSGSAGCNRFSGGYTVDGTMLTAGPLMATEMACPGAGMQQERAFFALMAKPVMVRLNTNGLLGLFAEDGTSAILAPVY